MTETTGKPTDEPGTPEPRATAPGQAGMPKATATGPAAAGPPKTADGARATQPSAATSDTPPTETAPNTGQAGLPEASTTGTGEPGTPDPSAAGTAAPQAATATAEPATTKGSATNTGEAGMPEANGRAGTTDPSAAAASEAAATDGTATAVGGIVAAGGEAGVPEAGGGGRAVEAGGGDDAAVSHGVVAADRLLKDRLVAGLVLVGAVVGDAGQVSPESWRRVAELHGDVVRSLLDAPDGVRQGALSRAAVLGGGAALMKLAESAMDAGAALDDGILADLMELSELITAAGPEPSTAADILVGEQAVPLSVSPSDGSAWCVPLPDAARAAAESAVDEVLAAFPGRPSAAASWPFAPHLYWPPGVALRPVALDLPSALWLLGEVFGLQMTPVLTAGVFDGAEFSPLRPAAGLLGAARALGRDLLVPAATGWELHPADGSRVRPLSGRRTLDGAAALVWGEEWARRKREAHAAELESLGWHFVDLSRPPQGQPLPDLRVIQVGQLERYCLDKSGAGSVLVLGGTRQSGRSAIVRQLAQNLAGRRKNPWLVQVISGPTRELPGRHSALAVATHAVGAVAQPAEQAGRRLLVFEDLQPTGDGNASDVLRHVAQRLHITVLGVLEYAEHSRVDWNTDDTFAATAVDGRDARTRFVEDLARADTRLDPAPALAALAAGTRIDLRGLTRLMSGDDDVPARRAARFAELTRDQRTALVLTAAVSLVSQDVPEDLLGQLPPDDRTLFGVEPGRAPETLRLTSQEDCVAVLLLHADAGRSGPGPESGRTRTRRGSVLTDVLKEQLAPELDRLLRDGDPAAVELLRGIRLYRKSLCEWLLKKADRDGALDEWEQTAPLMSLVDLTGLVGVMPEPMAQRLVERMAGRARRETEQLSPGRLLTLMHACQHVESLMSPDTLDELASWLIDAVEEVFTEHAGRPDERYAMLQVLERMNRDDATNMVAERVLDVLSGLSVRVEDYRLVQKVDQLQRRALRRPGLEAPLFPVDQESPVRELLERKPDAEDGIGVLFEAMNLRLSLVDRDWEKTYPPYEIPLNQAFRTATAAELASALQSIRSPIPQFGTWLLTRWAEFPAHVRSLLLRQAGASDAAALLSAVARLRGSTAFAIIRGVPGDHLASTLAKRAATAKDAKGIGQLLSVARSVEDLFQEGESSFATDIAETLGQPTVLELMRYDLRTSVQYHVIKGVWDAQASYRSAVMDEVLTVVVDALRHGRKPWGPEIALRLLREPELGLLALAELHDRTRVPTLLAGMTSAPTAHARALFHRVGRTVHPEVPAEFLRQWELGPFVEGLTTSRPMAALEVCAEVARTLTDADVPDAGRDIARETGGAEQWARRLRVGREQEAFTQAVRHLTTLDPEVAGEVLDRLRATRSHTRIGDGMADVLLARLRHALFGDPTCAPAMLRAIHTVRPQLAKDLLTDIEQDKHASFVFRGEIQQMENPVAQSAAARDLVRIGATPDSAIARTWVEQVYLVRIQSVRRFSSPHAVLALLRMLSSWEPHWGRNAAREVNVSRLCKRLAHGALTDVSAAVDLVRTMAALDQPDGARKILATLLDLDGSRLAGNLDVHTLCALLDIARELEPDAVRRLSLVLDEAVRALIARPVVSDERAHWLRVGRACRLLERVGAAAVAAGEPPLAPNVAYAPMVAWAATGLRRPGWGRDALQRAEARLTSLGSLTDPTDRACALSASGRGCAPGLRESPTAWDIGTAPFWLLRMLHEEAAGDAYLGPVLAASEPVILERAKRDTDRCDWDASRLRLMLDARGFLRTGPRAPYRGPRPRGA